MLCKDPREALLTLELLTLTLELTILIEDFLTLELTIMSFMRKKITQVEQVLVDQATGEILNGHLVYFPNKVRAEGWFMAWQEGFERLAMDKDMTMEALRVLHYVFARLDFENHLRLSQADIARALEMKPSAVSRAMKLLLQKDILVFLAAGETMIFVWYTRLL